MKKVVSLLLTAVLLAAMLSVFAVPAFAAMPGVTELTNPTTIEGAKSYDELAIKAPVTIESGANVTVKALYIDTDSLIVKSGATVSTDRMQIGPDTSVTIESGATVIIQRGDHPYKNLSVMGTLTIAGELLGNNTIYVSIHQSYGKVSLQPGGVFDVTFSNDGGATDFYDAFSLTDFTVVRKGNRVIAETEHKYGEGSVCIRCDHVCDNSFHNGVCPECNAVASAGLDVGSALSEGNMAIIIGIVALVIGLGGGFFIGRKKKPALASGENTDEE